MQAIILAAGEGTRLRPFTMSKPKVMLPIGNKPILAYVVKALVENGLKEIIMVVGYKKERIMSFFGDGSKFGAKITYDLDLTRDGAVPVLGFLKTSVLIA